MKRLAKWIIQDQVHPGGSFLKPKPKNTNAISAIRSAMTNSTVIKWLAASASKMGQDMTLFTALPILPVPLPLPGELLTISMPTTHAKSHSLIPPWSVSTPAIGPWAALQALQMLLRKTITMMHMKMSTLKLGSNRRFRI